MRHGRGKLSHGRDSTRANGSECRLPAEPGLAKYNQILRIAGELEGAQVYWGKTPFTKR
jgi:hypothetical protein